MQRGAQKAPSLSVAFEAAENISTNMSPPIRRWATSLPSACRGATSCRVCWRSCRQHSPFADGPPAPERAHAEITNTTPAFNFKEVAAGADDKHYLAGRLRCGRSHSLGRSRAAGSSRLRPAPSHAGRPGPNSSATTTTISPTSPSPALPIPPSTASCASTIEYTNEELMFPGLGRQDARAAATAPFAKMTQAIAEVEMMAHGGSVLEIEADARQMGGAANSNYARRITAGTELRISGPPPVTLG